MIQVPIFCLMPKTDAKDDHSASIKFGVCWFRHCCPIYSDLQGSLNAVQLIQGSLNAVQLIQVSLYAVQFILTYRVL